MTRDPLFRAWVALVALSALATAVALAGQGSAVAGAAILTLAWVKSRVILGRYLGLYAVPGARRAFGAVLGLFLAGVFALYLVA